MQREYEFLWKDPNSVAGDSASLWRSKDGAEYVVVGVEVDDETRSQLRYVGEGETGVVVPAEILDRLRDAG